MTINGYKSYISGGLVILFAVLYAFEFISVDTFLKLFGIFAGLGIVSLRSAIGKISKSGK